MTNPRCTKTPGVRCVRVSGHAGVCSACPSSATLDWDLGRRDAETLQALDFEADPSLDWLWDELNGGAA